MILMAVSLHASCHLWAALDLSADVATGVLLLSVLGFSQRCLDVYLA